MLLMYLLLHNCTTAASLTAISYCCYVLTTTNIHVSAIRMAVQLTALAAQHTLNSTMLHQQLTHTQQLLTLLLQLLAALVHKLHSSSDSSSSSTLHQCLRQGKLRLARQLRGKGEVQRSFIYVVQPLLQYTFMYCQSQSNVCTAQ
jgi:hypothetical protein